MIPAVTYARHISADPGADLNPFWSVELQAYGPAAFHAYVEDDGVAYGVRCHIGDAVLFVEPSPAARASRAAVNELAA